MKMPSSMALLLMLGLLCCSSWAAAGLDFQDEAQFLEELHRLKPWKPDSSSQKKQPMPSKPVPGKAPVPIPMNNGGLVAVLNRINLRGSSVPKFVAELMVGNPAVPLNFSIDTMGHQTAIPSQLCAIPSAINSSKSSKPALPTNTVPCSHPVCKGPSFTCDRIRKRCIAFDRYSNKPLDLVTTQLTMQKVYPSGSAAEESRTLGGLVVGCSDADAVANVVSLSPLPTSLVSQLASAGNLPRKFAYCLGKPRGAFFVGGADYVFRQQNITAKLQYFPMLTSTSLWQRGQGYRLALKSIAVGSSSSQLLPIDPTEFKKGIIIGTKARYTSLVEVAYKVVRKHFMRVAMASGPAIVQVPSPFPELNLCYRLPPGASVIGAPKIFFTFEGNSTLTVEPRNYIVRWRNTDVVCMGIVSAGPLGRVSVIGTLQQEEMLVEFDLDNNRVGISEQLTRTGNSCQYFDFAPWTFEPLPRTDGGSSSAAAPAPAALGSSLSAQASRQASAPTSSQLSIAAVQASAPAPSQVTVAATPSSSRIMLMEDADSPSAAERIHDEDSTAPIGEIIGTPMASVSYPIDQVASSPVEPSYDSIDQVAASPTGQSSLRIDQVASSLAGVAYRMNDQTAMPPVGPSSLTIDQVAASPVGPSFEVATSPASLRVDQVASSPVGAAFIGMSEQVATLPVGSSSFTGMDQVATSPVGSSSFNIDQAATSPVGSSSLVAASPVSLKMDQVAKLPVGSSFYTRDQVAAPPVSFSMDQVATSPVGSSFYMNDQVATSPVSFSVDQVATSLVGSSFYMNDQVATSPTGQASIEIDQVASSPVGGAYRMSDQVAPSSSFRIDQVAASPVGPSLNMDQVATSPMGSSFDQVATSPAFGGGSSADQIATSPVVSSCLGLDQVATSQVATPPVGASSLRVDQAATSPVGSSYRTQQVAASPNAAYGVSEQTAAAPAGSFRIDQVAATSPVGSSFAIQIDQAAESPAGASSIYSTWDQVATSPAGSLRKGAISPVGSSFEIDQVAASPSSSYYTRDQVATSPAGSLRKGAISPVGSSSDIDQVAASPAGASSLYSTWDQVATSPAGSLRKGAISPVGSSSEVDQVAA